MQTRSLFATLQSLCGAGVDFIVIGGLAAVLQGAPVQTYDVDVVYSRETANLDRLLKVLGELDAIFRVQPERCLRPNRSHLEGSGHLNLLTRYGPLDVLGSAGPNVGFPDLLPHCREMDLGEGVRIHVLKLEAIISIKEQLASEKDLAVLPILRQTLRESSK